MNGKKLGILVLLVFCFAIFGGCGNDSKEEETSLPSAVPTLAPTPTPEPQMVKVAEVSKVDPGLNVRKEASTEGEILGMAETGDQFLLMVETAKDGWYQIEYEGKTAYISAEFSTVREVTMEEAAKLRSSGSASGSTQSSSSESSSESPSESDSASSKESSASSTASRDLEDGES